ncbi:MAG: hypothetical protein JST23_07155 [Bacteroidetes bacterium]|nr:hypothetical protein [Bacteroidota bacterium]
MKKAIFFTILLLNINHSFSQKRIDEKYKNPGKGNATSRQASGVAKESLVLKNNIDSLKKKCNQSEYERKMQIANAEMNAFNINGNEIWLYEDIMYGGRKKVLKVGKYTLKDLGIYWNDRISSMLVPTNLAVILYSDDTFSGMKDQYAGYGIRQCMNCYSTQPTILSYDYGNFNTMGLTLNNEHTTWNDLASSIEIINK